MGVKATFILDERIMEQTREYVSKKKFKSLNAFVEKALKDEIAKMKKEEIKAALLEASQDPLFLADLKEIEEDFAPQPRPRLRAERKTPCARGK